jgi:hypothetical protein
MSDGWPLYRRLVTQITLCVKAVGSSYHADGPMSSTGGLSRRQRTDVDLYGH